MNCSQHTCHYSTTASSPIIKMRYISCVVLAALSMSMTGVQAWYCTDYKLTNETNCNCSEVHGGQEIKCLNANISISREGFFNNIKLTHINCKDVVSAPLTLPTLRLGRVTHLELQDCLPTEVSIRDIMDHLGIDTLSWLTIRGKVDRLAKGQLAKVSNEVRLEGLGLTHIDQDIFVDQNTTESDIRKLYLDRNNISQLDDTVFMKLKQLSTFKLSFNQLSILPADLFVYNKELFDLDLSNNRLQSIPSELFGNQENLYYLNISNNQLKHLEGEWTGLERLSELDLSNNQLINIGDGKESVLRNVGRFGMTLILNNNNLTRVYQDWLRRGKEVYLENNNIQTLKMNCLSSAAYNLNVFLVGNNITYLDIDVSDPFIDSIKLHLTDNPLTCNFGDPNSTTCGIFDCATNII